MNRVVSAITLACASLLACYPCLALAHAVAGARTFPVTLTIDDPGVADEASLPTLTWQRSGAEGGPGPVNTETVGWEFDKRLTERLGITLNDSYVIEGVAHDKTRTGFQDVVGTVKYQTYVDAPHEFIVSLGVIREFARTGTTAIGADTVGNTTPTVYFGKGLGDLPIGWLRPLAITGTAGFAVADQELKSSPPAMPNAQNSGGTPITGIAAQQFNNGYANRWVGGLSVQYSIPYLQSQVRDIGLHDFRAQLIPVVELTYSSPAARPNNLPMQLVAAPGVLYLGNTYQVGLEALVPVNKASGSNVGVIAQFHLFLDDLLPNSLGKPLFNF